MKSYSEFIESDLQEREDYDRALELFERNELNEDILSGLSSSIRSKLDFIKTLAANSKAKIEDVVKLFKDSRVFKFFSSIRFDLNSLWKIVKTGYAAYGQLQRAIAEYIAKTKVGKWTEDALRGLDEWLQNHPRLKRIGGYAVAALLIYIWLNMSFTGDISYDFDFSDVLTALSGKYALSTLFAGTEGTRLLILFATGMIGLGFPWPGPTSVHFAVAVLNGLKNLVYSR